MWSGRRPPDPPAPHPRRGCPIAHTTLGPRGTQRAAPAATAWRNEGRGAAGPPPPPHPHPPSRAHPPRRPREPGRGPPAGPRRGRPTRPQAPVRPAHPRGAGDAGRRGHGDRPAGGRPGTRPALGRAHRSGGRGGGGWWGGGGGRGRSPSPSPRRRRRTGDGSGKAGNGSGPRQARGSETRQGAGPGEQQMGSGPRRTDGRRGAPTGCGHVTPTPQNRRWRRGWPRATARGMARNDPGEASRPPGRTAGSHRQRPPSTGAVPRHTQNDRLASPATPPPAGGRGRTPHGASRPPPTLHPEPQPARENALPPRTSGPPSPHTGNPAVRAKAPPCPASLSGLRGHCSTRGRHRPTEAGRRHPREARPARSQTAGNGGGRGHRRSHARDEEEGRQRWGGAGKHAQQGSRGRGRGRRPGTRKHQDTAGPPGKPARDPTATHTRGRSRNAWDAGRSWPSLERAPHPSPAARAGVPSTHLPPSIHPQQIRLPSKSDPEAQHPGDTLSSEGGPDRAHHTATGCGSGARAGTTGSSSPRLRGWGSRGRPGSRTPTPPPLPPGLTPRGRLRTTQHTHSSPLAGHPAGPSGTLPQLRGGRRGPQ